MNLLWLQSGGCGGCTMSLLCSGARDVLGLLSSAGINLAWHPSLSEASGDEVRALLADFESGAKPLDLLCVEGSLLTGPNGSGRFHMLAGTGRPMIDWVKRLAARARYTLGVGTCAAYGGIPAGKGNETGAMGVSAFLKKEGIPAPVINIPGCPPHPDWIVGTIGLGLQALATNTLGLLVKQGLDANGRPKAFYKNVHMNCPHLSAFEAGHMVKTMSDKDGCRFSMGCKGPRSACDSFERKWNNGVNWCVNNATCIGCTSPTFPDGQSPFYVN